MKESMTITAIQTMLKVAEDLQKEQRFKEAISQYQEIIEIDINCFEAWQQLADIYQKQRKIKLAISAYEKALLLCNSRYLSRRIHASLSDLYLQQGATELANKHHRLEIANNCLINHKYKIIYCPIAKNACTLFKNMMVEHSKDRERYRNSHEDIHHYASIRKDTAVALDNLDYLERSDYFKFAILRNPFERLVSAYLDKIVKHEITEFFAQELIKKVQQYLTQQYDLEQSISFQEFIQYIANTQDNDLDEHWKTQFSLIGRGWLKFDYLGQFEQLDRVIEDLENRFGFKITTNVINNHNRSDHITHYISDISPGEYHTKYPQELRDFNFKNGGFPDAKYFYTPELIKLVKIRFAPDIELYNNQFAKQLLSCF